MEEEKNRKAIIYVVVLFIIVGFVAILKHDWNGGIERPSTDYIALISHTERTGFSTGTEYTYYIYSEKKSYIYFKMESTVDENGISEEKEVASGRIKSKKDMKILEDDIEKDKKEDASVLISYVYNSGSKKINCDTFSQLTNLLW
mgnify:CR=1 FL=1